MKTLIRILALLTVSGSLVAGTSSLPEGTTSPDLENVKQILDLMVTDTNPDKIRIFNEVMAMTGDEAEKFWPVYREYEMKLTEIAGRGLTFSREFIALQAGGDTEDSRWNSMAKDWIKLRKDRLDLLAKYQKKIAKAVSPYRAAQFLQLEHQLNILVDLQIASEMPKITAGG